MKSRLLFWILLALFLMDKYLQYQEAMPAFLNNYLDDFLLMPLGMGAALLTQQYLVNPAFLFRFQQVVFVLLIFTLLFEGFFPSVFPEYTSDPFDFIAYTAGAFFFYFFQNHPAVKVKE